MAAEIGQTLHEALRRAGYTVDSPCGGKGRCGKCRVRAEGMLSACTEKELCVLSREEREKGFRLACCTGIEGDCAVFLDRNPGVGQVLAEGIRGIRGYAPMHRKLGVAIDIGTTTLAAQLYCAETFLASATQRNPQRGYGADVISRIDAAIHGQLAELSDCIRTALRELIGQLCSQAAVSVRDVDAMVITGNTAMLHLLTGTDPSPLAAAPFAAEELFGKDIPAAALGLEAAEGAKVYLPRCISAFVGADITAALLASGICSQSQTMLLTDIGTNGEIALWHQGALLCCATAAGPAFEGGNLSCGMQGMAGAIDRAAVEDGKLTLHVLGEGEATGICGSGVVDVLCKLLEMGVLDETGLLEVEGDSYALTERVWLSQKDVRQVQLAKSAIRAGMEALLDTAGVFHGEVAALQIAGGFGSYLSLDSAAGIGLIPPQLRQRSRVLGNAALSGAAMLLLDRTLVPWSDTIASQAKTVELSANPVFMDRYVAHMFFA